MPGWEMKIIEAEVERLLALAAEDAELRADLRDLARSILEASGDQPTGDDQDAGSHPDPSPAQSTAEGARADEDQVPLEPEPLHELTLGQSRPSPPGTGLPRMDGVDEGPDLDEIESRCRLKSEGARLASSRLRRIGGGEAPEGDSDDPGVSECADRFADAFYWLDAKDSSPTSDIALLDDLGGCFEALAEASALARGIADHGGRREKALHLLAEAQSAVRSALQRLNVLEDHDQLAASEWVRETAARHRVFIKRYLRADDLADPSRWSDLLDRIGALTGKDLQSRRQPHLIEELRHHLETVGQGDVADQDWQSVINAVDEMIDEGLPPSSKDLRDMLLPVLDDLPDRDDLPDGFRLVLREIDRFLASRPSPDETPVAPEPTAEVLEARRLLGGEDVVLIGGMCRPGAREALREALGLGELVWVETKEHQAVSTFEPAIARPEVAVVLLAIRWSSHAFGEIRKYCDCHGKPLVRLPGGYSPNQVAAQVLSQCGERLRGG